jgi:hypothetical protein
MLAMVMISQVVTENLPEDSMMFYLIGGGKRKCGAQVVGRSLEKRECACGASSTCEEL